MTTIKGKPKPLLTQSEVERDRLLTMARIFARVDRVLTGEDMTCACVDEDWMSAPAWSDGAAISFNIPHVGNVADAQDLVRITGLNYHELSHGMFTPRRGTPLVQKVSNAGLFHAFNMLEDQRIETLLVTQYPSTMPYFVAVVHGYLLKERGQWDSNFVLLYGRKYLPQETRDQVEARFQAPELVGDFKRVIDRYRVLAFPRDDAEGFDLIQEYAELLKKMQKQPTSDPNGHNGGGRADVPTRGKPQPHEATADEAKANDPDKPRPKSDDQTDDGKSKGKAKADDKTADKEQDKDADDSSDGSDDQDHDDDTDFDGDDDADGTDDADDDTDADEGDDDLDSDGDEGDDDESDGDDAGDVDSDGSGFDSETPSDGTGKSDQSGDGTGFQRGSGKGTPPKVSDDDFADMLDAAKAAAEANPQVQQEVRAKQDAIVNGDGDIMPTLAQRDARLVAVPPDVLLSARTFGRDLRRLRDEIDPGWQRGQAEGRLSVGRAIRGDDPDTVFDRWQEGHNDDADIDAVILVDYSSSMGGMMQDASQALWIIKRALEEINGRVTVFGFASGSVLMYSGTDKAHRSMYRNFLSEGSTNPDQALYEALRILHKSRRKTKFLISITDGAWGGRGIGPDMVDRCNQNGITTAMLYILPAFVASDPIYRAQRESLITWQNHAVRVVSAGATDLSDLAKGIVQARLRRGSK